MDLITSFFTALGLAADAFAAAGACGAAIPKLKLRHALIYGAAFGTAQFVMPVIGFFAASVISSYVAAYGAIVSFGVLCFIGGKTLYSTFKDDSDGAAGNPLSPKTIFVLAVATSIDALAVGAALKLTDAPLWSNALIIGAVAFALSVLGAYIGRKLGSAAKQNAERVAGVVLIAIGVKILAESLF